MRRKSTGAVAPDLERVRDRFEAWRKTKEHVSSPIPGVLWQDAVRLTETHSVYEVSRILRLDFNQLKRRVAQSPKSPPAPPADESSRFVEVSLSEMVPVSECMIELERPDGVRVRISVKGPVDPHLLEMAASLWRRP